MLAVGLYQSAMAPDDVVKIMFILVPKAWLSMFASGAMSVAARPNGESMASGDAYKPVSPLTPGNIAGVLERLTRLWGDLALCAEDHPSTRGRPLDRPG
jgi:hypothetical protein